jgi:hypothetical protein
MTLLMDTFQKIYKDFYDIGHISKVIAKLKTEKSSKYYDHQTSVLYNKSDRENCSFAPNVCRKSTNLDKQR